MTDATPELSRPVSVDVIDGRSGRLLEIEADAAERQRLAVRLDVTRIEHLTASVTLLARSRGRVRASGRLTARVVQPCVVTLEPVTEDIDEAFERAFAPPEEAAGAGVPPNAEVELNADELDAPDPIEDGIIDAGELVAQELALSIDPFPRAPGVVLDRAAWPADAAEEPGRENPFAVLASLKEKNDDDTSG